jgi:putative transposase
VTPSRFTEGQIFGVLREPEAGAEAADVCRKHGTSCATFWKYRGLDVSDAKRLKALEDGNAKLKRVLAEAILGNAMLKDITAATYGPRERRTARKIDSMSRACAPPGTRSLIVGTENGRRDANCCSGGKQAHEKISTAHARTSTKLDEQIETNALR